MQVDYDTYKQLEFVCKKCGWTGMGSELSNGNFYEYNMIGDLECPKCFERIAFWQAPEIKKGDEPIEN